MNRAAAITRARAGAEKLWAGTVVIHPKAKTGAHHHGPVESVIYVVSGRVRMKWGDRLEFTAEAGPGDFIYVRPFVPHPVIAVASVNPHGAEGGLFGIEESMEIAPAIEECRQADIPVCGPYSADTIYLRALKGEFPIVVTHYHDQGMIPVKLMSFGKAVNITLGLPFLRTSVDHGTAFDIAGRGIASPESMLETLRLTLELLRQRDRLSR